MVTSDYVLCLEAAGCKVLFYAEAGDYQGSWAAKVDHLGSVKYLLGAYGSCSSCDEYERLTKEGHSKKDIGLMLLRDTYTIEQLLAELDRDSDWDMDREEFVNSLKEFPK